MPQMVNMIPTAKSATEIPLFIWDPLLKLVMIKAISGR